MRRSVHLWFQKWFQQQQSKHRRSLRRYEPRAKGSVHVLLGIWNQNSNTVIYEYVVLIFLLVSLLGVGYIRLLYVTSEKKIQFLCQHLSQFQKWELTPSCCTRKMHPILILNQIFYENNIVALNVSKLPYLMIFVPKLVNIFQKINKNATHCHFFKKIGKFQPMSLYVCLPCQQYNWYHTKRASKYIYAKFIYVSHNFSAHGSYNDMCWKYGRNPKNTVMICIRVCFSSRETKVRPLHKRIVGSSSWFLQKIFEKNSWWQLSQNKCPTEKPTDALPTILWEDEL